GEVLHAAEGLVELGVLVAREVEEGEHVAVADVEEEVRAALVVAVLEDLDEREPEEVLVEGDRRPDVRADERGVVHAPRSRRRPLRGGPAEVDPPRRPGREVRCHRSTLQPRPRSTRVAPGSLRRMSGWSFAAVWRDVAAAAPDRVAVVCGEQTRTYGELLD